MVHRFRASSAVAGAFLEIRAHFFFLPNHCCQMNAKTAWWVYRSHVHKRLERIRRTLILPPGYLIVNKTPHKVTRVEGKGNKQLLHKRYSNLKSLILEAPTTTGTVPIRFYTSFIIRIMKKFSEVEYRTLSRFFINHPLPKLSVYKPFINKLLSIWEEIWKL